VHHLVPALAGILRCVFYIQLAQCTSRVQSPAIVQIQGSWPEV